MKALLASLAALSLLGAAPASAQFTADFTASAVRGPAPLSVTFVAQVSGGRPQSAVWDFGDGTTGSGRRANHVYDTPGTYSVSLQLSGTSGSTTATKPDLIVVTDPGDGGGVLEVDFSATPTTGTVPLSVQFSSMVMSGRATSGTWDFGDGGSSTARMPRHTYMQPGTYTVTLTASGPDGTTTVNKADLIVALPSDGGGGDPLEVDFEAAPTSGLAPLTVQFTSLATGNLTSGSWDFGDGGTSSARNPAHVYTVPGTYTVSLTAAGPDGTASASKPDLIVVGDPTPAEEILLTNANVDAGLTTMFTGGGTEHSGGAAWIDYNGDFLPDLLITNGSGLQNLLYRNEGDGTFTNISSRVAKPDPALEVAGVAFGDLDNDGDQDVVMAVDNPLLLGPAEGGPNLLYLNMGDNTFTEQGALRGALDPGGRRSITANLADFDRDGFLDVYLGNWQHQGAQMDNDNVLLQNLGDGTFADVTATYGVQGYGRDTLTCLWFDADLDGWPDLYVGNVGQELLGVFEPDNDDVLYRNFCAERNDFCDATGAQGVIGNDAKAAMGLDVGDVDNDGDWDLYITDIPGEGAEPFGNVLYLGNGDGTFADNSCDTAGVCVGEITWPCNFADFDNDGWIDLWVGTANPSVPDCLFQNDGDGTFTQVELDAFRGNAARGGTVADYDGDGDMDVVVVNYDMDSVLYRNDSANPNRWLEVKLIGRTSNRSAIGALVRTTSEGRTQMRRVSGGDSAHSQMDLAVHFGMGSALFTTIDVSWPSGMVQTFENVATNRFLIIDERSGIVTESLTVEESSYSAKTGTLRMRVRSTYGGRSSVHVEGYGMLTYDAESGLYEGEFPSPTHPQMVQVDTMHGTVMTSMVEGTRSKFGRPGDGGFVR